MRSRILLPIIAMLVMITVGCGDSPNATEPYEEPEKEVEQTEKIPTSFTVKDDADSTRITDGKVELDGGRYTNQLMTSNGIFDDSLEVQAEPAFAYAYAEGYEPADTVQVNLTEAVNEVFYLSRKEGEPEPEGPGEISINSACSDEGGVGDVTISVEKNADYLAAIDKSGEIIREADVNIRDGGTYTFEEVTSGTYHGLAKVKGVEEASKSEETTTLDCDVPDDRINGYAKVANKDSVRIDDAQITFNGGPYNHKVVSPNGIFDEVLDKQDVEVDISVSADGYKEVDPVTVSLNDDFKEIFILEKKADPEPEGPGEIKISANKCTDGDNPSRTVTITIENGASWVAITQNGDVINDLEKDLAPEAGQEVTFENVPEGNFTVVAKDNGKKSTANLTTEKCEEPNSPPEADYDYEITGEDGKTVKFTNTSSDPDGDQLDNDWDFDGEGDSVEEHPTFTFDDYGTKTVPLKVTDPHDASDSISKDIVLEEPAPTPPPSCPLTSGTVVHFDDNRIRSDKSKADARTQKANVDHKSGTYRITLWGYDQHDNRAGQNQTNESYYVSLMQDGQEVAQTNELGDLPDGGETGERETTFEDVVIDSDFDQVQGIHAAYPSGSANSLNASCASFERTGDVPLVEYTHKITVIAEEMIWVSGHKERLEDIFLSHGEAELIRTDKDPAPGTKVNIQFRMKLDKDQAEHSYAEITFEDGTKIQTPIFPDQPDINGWTDVMVKVDAEEFAGQAKELAEVQVIHGDQLDDSKTAGKDDVIFATDGTNGLLKLTWRTVDDGKSKILKTDFESVAYL